MSVLVVYHNADFDGLFAGAVCHHFITQAGQEADLRGWDHYDEPVTVSIEHQAVVVVDLPPTCVSLRSFSWGDVGKEPAYTSFPVPFTWIDHHASAIGDPAFEGLRGLRVDGVAACRLAYQWYLGLKPSYATVENFSSSINEPLALRYVGMHDVWDKSDERAEMLQYGLTLSGPWTPERISERFIRPPSIESDEFTRGLIERGADAKTWFDKMAAKESALSGHRVKCGNLTFWCIHSVHAKGSQWFQGAPEDVDAYMSVRFNGSRASASLYRKDGRTDVDLLSIAKRMRGGGHEGACGFPMTAHEYAALVLSNKLS